VSFIDARLYDGPADLSCDLCIVGAGAAGITLARMMARPGRRIILIESGGLDFDGDTQALYRGTLSGVPYFDLSSCRLRYFGGSTSHYGGFCAMPRRIDYEARPAAGLPGWPIGYDDLIGYLRTAAGILEVDAEELMDPRRGANQRGSGPALIEDHSKILRTGIQIQSLKNSRKFNPRFVADVEKLPDTQTFLYANLTHIGLDQNQRTIAALTVKTLAGRSFTVRPKIAVLACHTIEAARLLLASNDVIAAGIGNESDELGRNFMDHIHVRAGKFVPDSARFLSRYAHDYLLPEYKQAHWSEFQLTDEVRLQNDMGHYGLVLEPHYARTDERTGDAVSRLIHDVFLPYEHRMAADVGTLLGNPSSAIVSTLARLGLRERKPLYYHLLQHVEQSPNRNSRVTLLPSRDILGVPMVELHFDLQEADYHNLNRGQELVTSEVAALGWGRFSPPTLTPDFIRDNILGVWHNMGTTKMADSPKAGVVDRNLRVHGTDNLYVASCSVFPSATTCWPTIHLLALTLRLADHLSAEV
jgi:choline dehydrogenase-like flavoprotein